MLFVILKSHIFLTSQERLRDVLEGALSRRTTTKRRPAGQKGIVHFPSICHPNNSSLAAVPKARRMSSLQEDYVSWPKRHSRKPQKGVLLGRHQIKAARQQT